MLWINSAHEAIGATCELLTEIAPQWQVALSLGYVVEVCSGSPGFAAAERAAKAAWLNPPAGALERTLHEAADDLANQETPEETTEGHALPLPWHLHEAAYEAHQVRCAASAQARRPHMRVSGEYLHLNASLGPDLLLRNGNQATLQAMLRSHWQPVAWGQGSQYALAPVTSDPDALSRWLQHAASAPSGESLLRRYLRERNTAAAQGLDVFCVDKLPDWDCGMGVLMVFATPALAQHHMARLKIDPRVQWWPDLATADAQWRRGDWPPSSRVQLCPFNLQRDRVWEGDSQVTLL